METGPSSSPEQVTTTLLCRQLEAIDSWNRARSRRQEALEEAGPSREARLDAARQLAALDRAHAALLALLDEALAVDPYPLRSGTGCRAVLVHRQEWFVGTMTAALAQLGVTVVAALGNGADAVGVLVGEQPDLLLVEESLPMLTGQQVVAEAVRFSPGTVLVAQVSSADRIGDFLEAGVRAAVTRQVPPADVAQQMHALVRGSA